MERNPSSTNRLLGFTLIELLIVVAIIAILAAIAVPNFLEAQTRAKIARSVSDMRSLATAIESYHVDNNKMPKSDNPFGPNGDYYSHWWGFTSSVITTPIAYITSIPTMPFTDKYVLGFWEAMNGTSANQPYTVMTDTWTAFSWGQPSPWVVPIYPGTRPAYEAMDASDFFISIERASYLIYTCGPDNIDLAVWGGPMTYDASNGTTSFGDVYRFLDGHWSASIPTNPSPPRG
jgi:general secretion pathway protein G